jgi:hypothetical protein
MLSLDYFSEAAISVTCFDCSWRDGLVCLWQQEFLPFHQDLHCISCKFWDNWHDGFDSDDAFDAVACGLFVVE